MPKVQKEAGLPVDGASTALSGLVAGAPSSHRPVDATRTACCCFHAKAARSVHLPIARLMYVKAGHIAGSPTADARHWARDVAGERRGSAPAGRRKDQIAPSPG